MGAIWGGFVGLLEQALLFLSTTTGNPGWGIILFTLCVRVLMLPLMVQSLRSNRKIQQLQPMLRELQRKHGKDQRKLQEETLKLYQQYKVNPVGGCLPLLIQLPIFLGVYQAVYHLMNPAQHQFLSEGVRTAIQDPQVASILARPFLGLDLGISAWMNPPLPAGVTAGFQGFEYLILPVLSIVLQFGLQVMATPRVQDPQQKAMMQAMLFLPLVFGYIGFIFPSGAVLYWVVGSSIAILQQYLTNGWGSLANYLKFLPPDPPRFSPLAAPQMAPVPVAVEAGAGSAGEAAVARQGFWDVLRPLTEPEAQRVNGDEEPSESNVEDADEQVRAEVRRQSRALSSRRPRRRR